MRTSAVARKGGVPARRVKTARPAGPDSVSRVTVRQILHSRHPQPKLTVGAPNDAFEQEADRVADRVMRMPEAEVATTESAPPRVQRLCAECEAEREKEEVRAKEEPGETPEIPNGFAQRFAALHGGGRPLPAAERSFFEPRFGRDFAGVRLHSGPAASELARSVQARAFTLGDAIVFGSGQYAPGTSDGRQLLAHELTHVVQQGAGGSDLVSRIQRAVRFTADFSNISLAPQNDASISGDEYTHDYVRFSADANVAAVGDTEAELDEWDVGILQDMVVNWEREYWRRDNADGRGRFVEQKFRPINTTFRDQEDGATTVWTADDEHQDLSALAKTPVGPRFRATTTITTEDDPDGGDTINGSDVTGMDASDGTRNIEIERSGTRFDTYISAHNTVTDEWRHLRRLNWNYQDSLDFRGSGAALAVGPERIPVGRHGPHRVGREAPRLAGTTANDAVADDGNWTRRRVRGWT
jgi:hypothetical protein